MKKAALIIAIALTASATAVSAKSAKFEMTQDNFETKVCYVAATKGMESAEQFITAQGLSVRKLKQNVKCNNTDLVTFAKRYNKAESAPTSTGPVQLVATNNDLESKICVESLTKGLMQTVAKYQINEEHIRCNGIPLPRFVKKNKALDLTAAVTPE
jgi:hypothetical protein